MPRNNSLRRPYFLMHFIIFIWGFTAVLGALISLKALALTWYRLLIAWIFLGLWIYWKGGFGTSFTIHDFKKFQLSGLLIGLHWLLFFGAIKQGGVSVALVALSSGALFTSFLEPIAFRRKIKLYEVIFGLLIIGIMFYIFRVNQVNWLAALMGVGAAFFGALFSVINARLIRSYRATHLSFFEMLYAWFFITIILFGQQSFSGIFQLTLSDVLWLLILGVICTAYAFTASLEILKKINPFTLNLSINLEPVYGIILALLIFGKKELMHFSFYVGTVLILILIVIEAIIKFKYPNKLK